VAVLPVRLVLLRPRSAENVGAVARAMRNFGLEDWAILAGRPVDLGAARRLAVQAEDLLDRARPVASLDEAVADCAWVVGTTSRRLRGRRSLSPEQVALEAAARGGRTAIVFGDERGGLGRDELRRCHDLSAIPAAAAQPSLNLAQAALVYAYELRRARAEVVPGTAPGRPARPAEATGAQLAAVEDALREALRGAGFLVGPERHAVRDLLATLRRGPLRRREAALWEAALRTLARRVLRGAGGRG
jgi:tRNA/rRNA methyltransferase